LREIIFFTTENTENTEKTGVGRVVEWGGHSRWKPFDWRRVSLYNGGLFIHGILGIRVMDLKHCRYVQMLVCAICWIGDFLTVSRKLLTGTMRGNMKRQGAKVGVTGLLYWIGPHY